MRDSVHHAELLQICTQVQIVKSNRICIAGLELALEGVPELTQAELQSNSDAVDQSVDALCQQLYKAYYIRRLMQPEKQGKPSIDASTKSSSGGDAEQWIAQLKLANGTAERWDPGWEIYHFGSDGRAYVKKGDQSRIAWAGTYLLDGWMGAGAKIGDVVKLKVFPYTEAPLDSFFHVFGLTLSDQFDEYKLLRFYFNVEANAVVPLLGFLSQQLNHYLVPFHFKALADPANYDRADAAVLYVASCHYQIVASIMTALPNLLGTGLRHGVPMLTRPWAGGIGAAQDPGSGASFGMHRCRLVAAGLFGAWLEHQYSDEGKLTLVEQHFIKAGIDLYAPYLNAGELDIFAQAIFVGGVGR